MTKKELNEQIVSAVYWIMHIRNGYASEEVFIVDSGHELYHTINPLNDDEEIVYCLEPEGLNSHIDSVIDEVESMLEDDDLIGLRNLAVEIAGSYISCDDDYYDIVRDLETETEKEVVERYTSEL